MTSWKDAAICTASLVLVVTATTAAQSARERLAGVSAIDCTFTLSAVGTWKSGVPQADVKTTQLAVRFDSVNPDDGTARVVGMFGPSDIIVRLSGDTLHLIQSFRDGPLYATTVFPKETRQGRLQAVHTRHEFTEVSLPGYTSSPEQYYGDCQVSP
jgi:hypothetical protein